ncbi:MAG: AAA family ATPase [Vicinamibacterales bacterium]
MPLRDVAGHRHLRELLVRAVERATLPPSVIFSGPEGVGKRLTAVALAQLLNCPTPIIVEGLGRDACGVCASCTRIARGVHSDVILIEPGETGAIKVDRIRDAIDKSAYRPFEGRRRVVIINEADAVLVEAQNALLKTLEEPPSASSFVLVTATPDVLLPTVRSRCQQIRFGRLDAADIAAVLVGAHEYDEAHAHAAAASADGSIGAALAGNSDDVAAARDAAASLLQGVAGSTDPRRRLESAKRLVGASDRHELARRLRALASLLRDCGVLLSHADERCLANADMKPLLGGLVRAFDADRTVRAFSAVDQAIAALERNASPKVVADWVAFQI